VKYFYCPLAGADPLTLYEEPEAKGYPSTGQGACPCTGQRGIAMATALTKECGMW